MRAIGLVGGMSPESTIAYYKRIVRRHREHFGNHGYPRIVIASVSFQRLIDLQHAGAWEEISCDLEREFAAVAAAGADFAIMATITMHKVLSRVSSPVPIVHALDAVAAEAHRQGHGVLGVTGTKFTMEDGFLANGLRERDLEVVLPDDADRAFIHRTIYDELIVGRVLSQSEAEFAAIADRLCARGADAILLACTELEMLTRSGLVEAPFLDSAALHADAAWRLALTPE